MSINNIIDNIFLLFCLLTMKKFNLKDYCFNLFDTMVANKLLWVLHVITQVFFIAIMLIAILKSFVFWDVAEGLIMLIFIPVVSVFIRLWFEFLGVMFSINNNTKEIKESLTKSDKVEKKSVSKKK